MYSNGGFPPLGYKRVAINLKTGVKRDLRDGEWSISNQEKVIWALGEKTEVKTVVTIFERRAEGQSSIQLRKHLI